MSYTINHYMTHIKKAYEFFEDTSFPHNYSKIVAAFNEAISDINDGREVNSLPPFKGKIPIAKSRDFKCSQYTPGDANFGLTEVAGEFNEEALKPTLLMLDFIDDLPILINRDHGLGKVVEKADDFNRVNIVNHFKLYRKELVKVLEEWLEKQTRETLKVNLRLVRVLKNHLPSVMKEPEKIMGNSVLTQNDFCKLRSVAETVKSQKKILTGKLSLLTNRNNLTYTEWDKVSPQVKNQVQRLKHTYLSAPVIMEVRRFCYLFNLLANFFNRHFFLIESTAYKRCKEQFVGLEMLIYALDGASKECREKVLPAQNNKFNTLRTLAKSRNRYSQLNHNQGLFPSFDDHKEDDKGCILGLCHFLG